MIELKLSLNKILKMKILLFFTKNLIYLLLHLNENNITDIEVIKLNKAGSVDFAHPYIKLFENIFFN